MFYGAGSDEPLFLLRKMILSKTVDERKAALAELFPFVEEEHQGHAGSDGRPAGHDAAAWIRRCTSSCRKTRPSRRNWPRRWASSPVEIKKRGEALHETNPMMGHRGVRLGITYPEVTEMQVRAIFEAAAELKKAGKSPKPELMVPVTCDVTRARRDQGDLRPRAEGSRSSRRASKCIASTAR